MPDKKFILSEPEAVTLAGHTIDKLIRAGDGDAALLYLYILKTQGQSTLEEAVAAMGKSAGWVASAMATLSRIGLVKSDDSDAIQGLKAPLEEPRRYTVDELNHAKETDSDFSALVDETQCRLGKILTGDELGRLYGIYDTLRLPAEVIMLLVNHCIEETCKSGGGRMPSLRYVEKAAYEWEREGLLSLDRAEEYLKSLASLRSARGEMKAALQIRGRELSASEKRYVDGWISLGFEPEAVEIAYDKTVFATGKLAWNYMEKILGSWHSKGLHTAQEVQQITGGPPGSKEFGGKGNQGQKYGAASKEELQRAQQLLDKVRKE